MSASALRPLRGKVLVCCLALAGIVAGVLLQTSPAPAQQSPKGFVVQEATVAQVEHAFRAGTLTCTQLVRAYIDRIAKYDDAGPKINAVSLVNPRALEIAARFDRRLRSGAPIGPLFCIPVLLKDNIDTSDMPTTNGSAVLKDSIPSTNAPIVDNLRRQGALILGKADMGEFANEGYNSVDGQTLNPYKLNRNTSGSSSGTAAAVAANMTLLGIGTDTSSSVRGPAAYTGIVGLRPTTGIIPRTGIAPKSLTFDTAGPMGRTVRDVALLFNALAFRNGEDPLSKRIYDHYPKAERKAAARGKVDYTADLSTDALKGKRIGIVRDFFGGDPEVDALARKALATMKRAGATLVEVHPPESFLDFYVENGLVNIRFVADYGFRGDFERYLRSLGPDVPKTIEEFLRIDDEVVAHSPLPPEELVLEILRRSLTKTPDSPAYRHLKHVLLPRATQVKLEIFRRQNLDALAYPAQSTFAYPIENPVTKIKDPTFVSSDVVNPMIFPAYSSVGFPSLVVPMGFGSQGLPMDIALMGRPYSEKELFGIGYAYEQASNKRKPSPITP